MTTAENDAPWCPECGPTCPLHGTAENDAPRLTNACENCGDCYHPTIGPNTDGEPCDWCRDCGCLSVVHDRMTYVIPPGKSDA